MVIGAAAGAAVLGPHDGADDEEHEGDGEQGDQRHGGVAQQPVGLHGGGLQHVDGRGGHGDQGGRGDHGGHGGGDHGGGVGQHDLVGVKGHGVVQGVLGAGGEAELARLGHGEHTGDADGLAGLQAVHGVDIGGAVLELHALGLEGGIVGQRQGEGHVRGAGGDGGGIGIRHQAQHQYLGGIVDAHLHLVGGHGAGGAGVVRQGDGVFEGRALGQGELLFLHQRLARAQGQVGEQLAVLGVGDGDVGIGDVAVVLDGKGQRHGLAVGDGGLVGGQDVAQLQPGIGPGDGDLGQGDGLGVLARGVGHPAGAGHVVSAHGGGELDGLALAGGQAGDGLGRAADAAVFAHADVFDLHVARVVKLILHVDGLVPAHHLGIDGAVDGQVHVGAGVGDLGALGQGLHHHVAAVVHLVVAQGVGQFAVGELLLGDVVGLLGGDVFALLDQGLAAVAKGGDDLAVGILQGNGLGQVAVAGVGHAHGNRHGAGLGQAGRLHGQGKADGLGGQSGQRK